MNLTRSKLRLFLPLGLAVLLSGLVFAIGLADDRPLTEVILATPVSSRINSVGDPVKAILAVPITLKDLSQLPVGTSLTGYVKAVESSTENRRSGRLQMVFNSARLPSGEIGIINLIPDTPDGWLSLSDGVLSVWTVTPQHSTRLLNTMIRRRLPSDRAVWSQALGLNTSGIPDPDTDEFIQEYNRHDVLLGAGDRLRVRVCP